MVAIAVIFFWLLVVLMCLWHAAGFLTNDRYNYQRRCKNYHGIKMLCWGAVLIVFYYIPWVKLGIF